MPKFDRINEYVNAIKVVEHGLDGGSIQDGIEGEGHMVALVDVVPEGL
jgi:hypothetical protein